MKRLALALCLLTGQAWAASPDVGFYLRKMDTPRDVDALNSNFRTLSDAIRRLNVLVGESGSGTSTSVISISTPIYITNGMVGVGTDDPAYLLDVNGTFQATGNGGVGLVVDGNANVGIGIAAPAYTLDLSGTFHVTGGITFDSTLSVSGGISAASFTGDGSALTALNASQLTSGTIPNARQDSSSVTLQANTFNGASQLIQTTAAGLYPGIDGSLILRVSSVAVGSINLSAAGSNVVWGGTVTSNASQFSGSGSGSSPLTALSSSVTLQGNTFNEAERLVKTSTGNAFCLSGPLYSGQICVSPEAGATEMPGIRLETPSDSTNTVVIEADGSGLAFFKNGTSILTLDKNGGVGLTSSGYFAGNGSLLTGVLVAAANVQVGSLGSSVVASSIALAAVGDAQINAPVGIAKGGTGAITGFTAGGVVFTAPGPILQSTTTLWVNLGRVGIGTTAPAAALEIVAGANVGSGFKKPLYSLTQLNTSTPIVVGVEVMGPSPTYDTYIGTGTSAAASWLNSRTQTYP